MTKANLQLEQFAFRAKGNHIKVTAPPDGLTFIMTKEDAEALREYLNANFPGSPTASEKYAPDFDPLLAPLAFFMYRLKKYADALPNNATREEDAKHALAFMEALVDGPMEEMAIIFAANPALQNRLAELIRGRDKN